MMIGLGDQTTRSRTSDFVDKQGRRNSNERQFFLFGDTTKGPATSSGKQQALFVSCLSRLSQNLLSDSLPMPQLKNDGLGFVHQDRSRARPSCVSLPWPKASERLRITNSDAARIPLLLPRRGRALQRL